MVAQWGNDTPNRQQCAVAGRVAGAVAVAMSGGVDSSVAAALLVEQGYAVTGVMLRLWAEPGSAQAITNRCCAPEAVLDARRVADQLGIPFYVLDAEAPFKEVVVDYFVDSYAGGRTPNPCIRCNRRIRFGWLLDRVLALGVDRLATGHYARVRHVDGRYQLLRGVDESKDQSYMLHAVDQRQLAHALFPLGTYTKAEVRQAARARRLPVAERPESQDVCFLADGDYRRFLRHCAPHLLQPGPILDSAGRRLGTHQGVAFYTIGQRKGLGIAAEAPLYVLALDVARNAVIVGRAEELGRDRCHLRAMHYVSGQEPEQPFSAEAQIRYRARPTPVDVLPLSGGSAEVRFEQALRDVTPGQFLVLYQGEVVIGGGEIVWEPVEAHG